LQASKVLEFPYDVACLDLYSHLDNRSKPSEYTVIGVSNSGVYNPQHAKNIDNFFTFPYYWVRPKYHEFR